MICAIIHRLLFVLEDGLCILTRHIILVRLIAIQNVMYKAVILHEF